MDFLEEYRKLKLTVPRPALFNTKSENSEYTSYAISNRNVYICMGCDENEDCHYGYWIYNNKNVTDCSFVYNTEIAYECIDVRKSYNMAYCQDCSDCRDLFLCHDCIGSSDCFGCAGLRRKQYNLFNRPLSKEEFVSRTDQLKKEWKTAEGERKIRGQFAELGLKIPRVYSRQLQNENCTGDYIYNSKNCLWSFDVRRCEDSQYLYNTFDLKNCSDMSYGKEGEFNYEDVSSAGNNLNFCYVCWYCANMDFCELCFDCSDCLGCIGLNKKHFCILNKQYGKEEYTKFSTGIKKDLLEKGWYSGKLPDVFWEG